MLTAYRDVLALPGATRLSLAAYIARQPLSIVSLGIVIYISGVTGSYAEAGILAAAFQIPAALFAIVTSRWTDRYGQARVLPPVAAIHALALVSFVLAVQAGAPLLVQAVVVGVAGASQPAIGAVVRARWSFVVGRDGTPGQLRAAFAVESLVDEVIFSLGPIIVTALAINVALPAPILLGAALVLVGSLLLAIQRATQPPPTLATATAEPRTAIFRLPGMLIAICAALGLGMVFGAYEVAVVAFTKLAGHEGASGIILALWAVGSLIGGLWFGSRHWRMHLPTQTVFTLLALTLTLTPAPFVRSIPILAITTFIGGAAVAPALISAFTLAERLVPNTALTEGLTWATSGLAIGFSAGSAISGLVIDATGTSWAFVVPVVGVGVATVVVAANRRRLISIVRPYEELPPTAVHTIDPIPGPAPGTFVDDAQ